MMKLKDYAQLYKLQIKFTNAILDEMQKAMKSGDVKTRNLLVPIARESAEIALWLLPRYPSVGDSIKGKKDISEIAKLAEDVGLNKRKIKQFRRTMVVTELNERRN
jgi:hypothetical protein